jgi:predicted RNA methylase
MRQVAVREGEDVFLDYGAGKGRVVVLAAMLPFRRVLGVEISPDLAELAQANVRRAARHLQCPDVEIVSGDATDFVLPKEATVLYFFDPFSGPVLERVLERIRVSLTAAPRPLRILYADPNHFAPLAAQCDWLRKCAEVRYPVASGSEPIHESYYIYEAVL